MRTSANKSGVWRFMAILPFVGARGARSCAALGTNARGLHRVRL
jgi:hypothetical protein